MEAVWDLALFVAGIAVAAAGYLTKRWWEGRTFRERLQEATGLAALKQHLDRGGSLESLEDLKRQLSARRNAQAEIELEVLDEIELKFQNQLEMNLHQSFLLEVADKHMDYLSEILASKLAEREQAAFEAAQEEWKLFAQRQAEFASLIVEGGSMQPMVHAAELEALTVERAGRKNSAASGAIRMTHRYALTVHWSDEDGVWIAEAPDLKPCAAHGDTPEKAVSELRAAMALWLEVAREEGWPIPEPRFRAPAAAAE